MDHSGVGCGDYHGVWQYLRLLDLVTTPRDHASFYLPTLRRAIDAGRWRVLVSGAVDYSMLAVTLSAFADAGVAGDVTVVDVCETPIRLCRWYADQVGAEINTEVGDILEHRPKAPYDVIVTHSFLGAFSPSARARLVSSWRDWLRREGGVATVIRIRRDPPSVVRFDAGEASAFRARVRREAALRSQELAIDLDALDALVEGYLAQRVVYPIGSREELAQLFETNGFRVDSLVVEPLEAAGDGRPSGPTLRGGAQYAKILAARE